MDETNKLEQLLQESHEPSSFINQALKDYSPSFPENLQNYCNDLYSKLLNIAYRETEKVNVNLEQFKSSVSYFIRNSERVQEAVNTLQEELKRLQEQFCSSLEEDKLQTLIHADGVSKKLEETLDLLRHAKEAQEVIDRSETWQKTTDWEALGIAIRSLRTSLKYLKEVPQYSEFEGHLQVLTKRFQELIRPQLYEYLSNRDSNSLQNIWSHCEEIGQKDVFIDIWVSERSSFIQKLWSNCWKDYFAQYGTEWDFSGQRQVSLDVHIPQSLDILKSFYEQVLTDISQQISIIAPLVSQPVGDFITASITMAFSSLDPPLADSYHFKEDMSINWLEDWYSVFEFYHNVMKECLYFAHKAASLAYTHCSTYLDIQVAISAVLEPAIKLVTNFPDLIDFVWCAYCKALVEKEQEEDNLPYDNAVQDVSSRISLLSRKVDNYVDHLRIMDSFMDICRQWVLGSQPSCLSILYRTSGRMIGNYILDKVSLEHDKFTEYIMTSEQTWTPIRSLFRLAVSICRLGNTCWRHICEGLHSCFHALEPILDGYSSDSSNRQYQLETLVREFVKTKSMDIHEFISKWFILTTDKENLDCLSFDRSKGPLGFHSNEFANDPFEDTLLSLRQVLLELIFHKIRSALNEFSESLKQTDAQRISEDEIVSLSNAFDRAPETHIVQAGEYLLLIPQMLETLAPDETLELTCCLPRSYDKNDVIYIMNNGPDCRKVNRNEFVRQWISVIGIWTMSFLIERIMATPKLTDDQCQQLSTNVEYLINIMTALGIPILREFRTVYELLSPEIQAGGLNNADEVSVFPVEHEFCLGRPLGTSLPSMEEIIQVLGKKKPSLAEVAQ